MIKPIFIIGAHKSGTSLLRNLLDNHNELFILPMEDHFFQHTGFWTDYAYRYQEATNRSQDEIKEELINWIKICNSSNDRYADSKLKGFFDLNKFTEKINVEDKLGLDKLMKLYFNAVYESLYQKEKPDNLRFVSKSVENAEFVMDIKKLFPDAKFIHILRNPYATFVGLRNYKSKKGKYPMVSKITETLYNSFYYSDKNKRLLEEDYFILKYETLLTNTNNVMRDLAEYLEINFDDSLLKPTVMGEKWKGNSTSNKEFVGIDASPIHNWEKEIKPYEVFLINNYFESFLRNNDYKVISPKGNIYRPMKGESLFKYLINRAYKYYLPLKN